MNLRLTAMLALALLLVPLVLVQPVSSASAPGSLDPSFGSGGVLTGAFGGPSSSTFGSAVALQSDGKILVGGFYYAPSARFGVARFNPDGALDLTFGTLGNTTTVIGTNAYVQALAVQSDGKILAAGYSSKGATSNDFALARYNSDGNLDSTFGPNGNGTTTTDFFGSSDVGREVLIQNDGKIIVAGSAYDGSNYRFALVRYTGAGALDSSFGGTGKVTTSIGSGSAFANAAALQSDGKIVLAGNSLSGMTPRFTAARYSSAGTLDSGFGTGGIAMFAIGIDADIAVSVSLQSDGKIVLAGYSYQPPDYVFAAARLNGDGSLDTSFGGTGKVSTPVGGINDFAYNAMIQQNGRIILTGYAQTTSGNQAAGLTRLQANGTLDSTFGTGGKEVITLGCCLSPDKAILQPDGKILQVGSVYDNTRYQFFVMRILGDPAPDSTIPSWTGVSTLTAVTLSSTSVLLSWTPASDNVGVTSYRIYQGTNVVATLPATTYTYVVTGLTEGTSYTFKVEAGDSAENWSTAGPSANVSLPPPTSFLAAFLPWLVLVAVIVGFVIAIFLTKPKGPKMG